MMGPARQFRLMTMAMVGFWLAVAVCIVVFSRDPEPTAADRFGCAKTYINARGEDTGECE